MTNTRNQFTAASRVEGTPARWRAKTLLSRTAGSLRKTFMVRKFVVGTEGEGRVEVDVQNV